MCRSVRPPRRPPDPRRDARGAPLADELLADFAENAGRGSPVDDLLRTLAESMRRDWQLARVEVWTGLDDPTAPGRADPRLHRTLVVPSALDPDADPVPPPLEPAELGMLRRVGVAGPGWLRLWVPRLLDGHENAGPLADRQLRFAPALHGGSVLALVVVERPPDALPFSTADDRGLAEVARRLAIVLRNRSLDEALQATLADLRRANADLQASRRRLVTTADAERKRIERDLHDGAQQRLVALAVGIRLVRDSLAACASPADIELLDELDRGVRESIEVAARPGARHLPAAAARLGPGGGAAGRGEAQRASRHGVRLEPGPPSRAGGGRRVLLLPRGADQRGQARPGVDRDDHAAGRAGRAAVRGRRLRSRLRPGDHPGRGGPVEHGRPDQGAGRRGRVARGAGHGTVVVGRTPVPRASRPSRRRVPPFRWGTRCPSSAPSVWSPAPSCAPAGAGWWHGLLFGLVGGIVLGTVAVADRTVTAYERLAAATGLADAQVLLPAAHETVFDQVEHAGVTASWTPVAWIARSTPRRSGSSRSAAAPATRRASPSPSSWPAGPPATTRRTRSSSASRPPRNWTCTSATR